MLVGFLLGAGAIVGTAAGFALTDRGHSEARSELLNAIRDPVRKTETKAASRQPRTRTVAERPPAGASTGQSNEAKPRARRSSPPTRTRRASPQSPATTATSEPLGALDGKTIVIDPGHNGGNFSHSAEINRLVDAGTLQKACDTTGTATDDGYSEASYNLDLSVRLAQILRSAGAHVVLTRSTNEGWGPCITERAAIGNTAHADAAISVHADGGPASGRGFHVIYPPSIVGLTDDIAAASYRLALALRAAFADGTEMPHATYIGRDGLDERSDLGGLNLSDVPKVFVETGNMRNSLDAPLLKSPEFRDSAATALALGLAHFLSGM